MHRPAATLLAASSLLLALTGCSGTPGHIAPAVTAKSTPTPTEDLRPWASLIAEQEQAYAKWRNPWDKDSCSALSLDTMPCGVEIMTGQFTAMTIALDVDGAVRAGGPTYLGSPPSQIANLWSETKAAADAASSDGQAWSDKCAGKSDDSCIALAAALTRDLDTLQTTFAGWKPYGA